MDNLQEKVVALEARIAQLEQSGDSDKPKAKTKAKRAPNPDRVPSPYNTFVKEKLAELKISHPDMSHQDRFKKCAELWKAQKA